MENKKKVLITGASTGIGFSCLELFSKNGWNVVTHYYEQTEKFDIFINDNKKIKAIECDFSNQD